MSLQTNLDRQDNIIRENSEESKDIIFTWLDGTLMKPSTASANTRRAEGIWSIRESDDVSKLTPKIWLSYDSKIVQASKEKNSIFPRMLF